MLLLALSYFVGMDEDLRNRFRRTDYTRRSQPMPRRPKPVPTTVVELTSTQPAPEKPLEVSSPPPAPPPPAPPTKPPKAPKPPKQKRAKRSKRPVALIITVIVVIAVLLAAGLIGWFVVRPRYEQKKENQATASAAATIPGITIPIYYPSNLPPGYNFNNDTKVIKNDVYYYSINDPQGSTYHVTVQPIPAAFNFTAFTSKFLNPNQYTTNVGSVVAGQVGARFYASIQTTSNTWILIWTEAKNSLPQLEAITRSFQQAK